MASRAFAKRVIGGIYSFTADKIYDVVVVKGTFRLMGINKRVVAQTQKAAEVAGAGPILDMPVGTGFFTVEMAHDHAGLVVGVDIAEGMVQKARRVAEDEGLTNVLLVRADAHRLPFPDGCFSVVGCWNGLPVMPGLVETVGELARVLAPGGTLFVSAGTLPVSTVLPRRTRAHFPTMLRPGRDITDVIASAGLRVTVMDSAGVARTIEATKPS